LLGDRLPRSDRHVVRDSIGGAYGVVHRLAMNQQTASANLVHDAATAAFDHGAAIGCVVAGAVALAGALLASVFLPAQPPSAGVEDDRIAEPELAVAND
jgi:hypothetical protein